MAVVPATVVFRKSRRERLGFAISASILRRGHLRWLARSNGCRAAQQVFHSGHALARRFFRRAAAAPVRFQAQGSAIAVSLESAKLTNVINHTFPHRRPFGLAVGFADEVF